MTQPDPFEGLPKPTIEVTEGNIFDIFMEHISYFQKCFLGTDRAMCECSYMDIIYNPPGRINLRIASHANSFVLLGGWIYLPRDYIDPLHEVKYILSKEDRHIFDHALCLSAI